MAMPEHRRGSSTPPKAGICDPLGGLASSPATLRNAYDAPHHGASRASPGERAKPSYGCHLLDPIHKPPWLGLRPPNPQVNVTRAA